MSTPLDSMVEFADNPEPRCACVLLLDISGSMSGEPIQQLNDGIRYFKECIQDDDLAALRTEVSIITYCHEAEIAHDFATVDKFNPPTLEARGGTVMSSAINLSLDMIEERKSVYRDNGITYYRPWIWLVCDGRPEHDTPQDWQAAIARVKQSERDGQAAFFVVGVEGADMGVLNEIGDREALRLRGLDFRAMFQWLSSSMSSVSQSQPSDSVPLSNPSGWAEV